jgi:probable F420-dependent oxidoreductase
MKFGVSFGVNSLSNDPAAIREIAQTAEDLGYSRLIAADHVLGADPDRPGGWSGPYTHEHRWHEPLVLFAYIAAVTKSIEMMTGVVILPQRQTALVAKQAAELDILSQGRFLLGVGNGWNQVEYEALGQDFRTRGRRMEEQVTLLRRLWTEPVVTFEGRFDRVTLAGIRPLPAHPIPIWMGGHSERALDRVGRLGDGWYPLFDDPSLLAPGLGRIQAAAKAAGRDAAAIGVQARVVMAGPAEEQVAKAEVWRDAGADIVLAGMNPATDSATEHIAAMRAFMEAAQHLATTA